MNKNIELKGYSFADGVHWHWKDREVAIIDPETSEIEWCVRKFELPQDVIDAVRSKKPCGKGWIHHHISSCALYEKDGK